MNEQTVLCPPTHDGVRAWMLWAAEQSIDLDSSNSTVNDEVVASAVMSNLHKRELLRFFGCDSASMDLWVKRLTPALASGLGLHDEEHWRQRLAESVPVAIMQPYLRSVFICAGASLGMTYESIGSALGISRLWARQLLKDLDVPMPAAVRAALREERDAAEAALDQRIRERSLANPEATIKELARWMGIDEARIDRGLGSRRLVHRGMRGVNDVEHAQTHQEVLAGIRAWRQADAGDRVLDYNKWAREHGAVSSQTVIKMFDSWSAGMALAGLEPTRVVTAQRVDRVPKAAVMAAITMFFRMDLDTYSYSRYEEIAKERGWPSGQNARARFGTWSKACDEARALLRYQASSGTGWTLGDEAGAIDLADWSRAPDPAELLEEIRQAAALTKEPLTMQEFDNVMGDRVSGRAAAILEAFGSWPEALIAAGVPERMSKKAHRLAKERGLC